MEFVRLAAISFDLERLDWLFKALTVPAFVACIHYIRSFRAAQAAERESERKRAETDRWLLEHVALALVRISPGADQALAEIVGKVREEMSRRDGPPGSNSLSRAH